jgi:hypothetical protein
VLRAASVLTPGLLAEFLGHALLFLGHAALLFLHHAPLSSLVLSSSGDSQFPRETVWAAPCSAPKPLNR